MAIHRIFHVFIRALDGVRRRPWLHLLSFLTLTTAFLSFTATLIVAVNLDHLLARWVGNGELTIYIKDNADPEETERLASAVAEIRDVERVVTVGPREARAKFIAELGAYGEIVDGVPVQAFPATIDVHLIERASRDPQIRKSLAQRLSHVGIVESVDLYDNWFERLSALSIVGRLAAWGLGLIAFAVAILVVTAVIRSGVNSRSAEIRVLGLVGATKRYVQLPFLLEGAIEATVAMVAALISLHLLANSAENFAGDILPLAGASALARLAPKTVLLLVAGSAVVGILGARISLRSLSRV
jgi:cell division transport system permease protein